MDKKNKIFALVIVIIALVLGTGSFLFYFYKNQMATNTASYDYVIKNVPYIGVYNHKGANSFLQGDTSMTLASLLEYWNPGQNDFSSIQQAVDLTPSESINEIVKSDKINILDSRIKGFNNYSKKVITLKINELKKYINSKVKTPLLLSLPLDENQPKEAVHNPVVIIIGIKDSEKKVIVHSSWLGNNYEISYDDFNALQEKRGVSRDTYIVLQPNNLEIALKNINSRKESDYPPRTEVMNKSENMFKNYAIAYMLSFYNLNDLSINYYEKIVNDQNFASFFPPYFKTMVLYSLAEKYFNKNDIDNALKYGKLAVELDNNLDQPFKDWPGYEVRFNGSDNIGQISGPYRVLGNIYKESKNFLEAKKLYEEAIKIHPGNLESQIQLKEVEKEL